jgi:uncharacterized protein YeaO (DUF488 family)
MSRVWTATYRYNGPDRLDITAKGKDHFGIAFAPTWDMVMGYKQGRISEAEYERRYLELLRESWNKRPDAWQNLLGRMEVTLVCFCRSGDFCHRVLLAKLLERHFGFSYRGERGSRNIFE